MKKRLCHSGVVLPHLGYLVRRWPTCLYLLENFIRQRKSPPFREVIIWAGGIPPSVPRKLEKRLIRKVSANPHCNRYHHPWHTLAVVVQAALISRWAGLDQHDHRWLILAALCHDLGHRGRFQSSYAGAEERRSALIAGRLLFLRAGSGRMRRKLALMIEQTVRGGNRRKPRLDDATAILRDADIFGSLFCRPRSAVNFTKSVMREQPGLKQQITNSQSVLGDFITSVSLNGFDHGSTKDMAARTSRFPAAIRLIPRACLRLGIPGSIIPPLRSSASARRSSDEISR